jgi:dipeptidyl aminopeptidase/acylaminoacyl peptidase
LPVVGSAQSVTQLAELSTPGSLELSPDGAKLWYKFGPSWWEVATAPNSKPKRVEARQPAPIVKPPGLNGTPRLTSVERSPDGKWTAWIDAETPYGPGFLYCRCGESETAKPKPLARTPIVSFRWASDSKSFWVIASNVTDEPFGQMSLDGTFVPLSEGAAERHLGMTAANDVVVWVQSDGFHFGTIWERDRSGRIRTLVDPNPQTSEWSKGWTQEVVRWKSAHGEELQGILAAPVGGKRLPLIVDPYSSWQNRFLNIPQLGNYAFVKAGFAVFFPDHRAPHTFPEWAFGEAYVGASKDRDPVDVLTDDVMTGVAELVRRGVADPERLFLYSTSNGASAIDQLLTSTHTFRAAVPHGGVSDWLSYYRASQPRGDMTIPGFLGGRKPEDSPDLYLRISPVYHVDKIVTPLLLVVGAKDSIAGGGSRYEDAVHFSEALRKAGRTVDFVVYPDAGHGVPASLAEQHVRKAIEFFRSAPPLKQ